MSRVTGRKRSRSWRRARRPPLYGGLAAAAGCRGGRRCRRRRRRHRVAGGYGDGGGKWGGGGCRPPPPAAARSRRHRVASNGGGGSSGHGRRRWAWRRRPWQRCAAGGRDEETEAVTAARETAAASAGAVEVSPVTSPLLLSRAPRRHAAARHPTAFSVAEYRRPFGIFAGAGGQAGGRLGGGAVVHRDSSRGGWTPTWGGGDIARTLAWCRRRCRCCWRCAPGGERRVRYRAPVGRPAARRGGAAAAAVRVGGRGAGAR